MGGPEQPWGWGQGSRVPGARGRSSELSRGCREPSPQCRFASAGSRLRDTCKGVVWTSPGGTLPGRVFPPQAVCASPAGSRRSSVRGGVGSPDLGARAQTHAHTNHLCMHTQLTRLCMAARAHTHSRTLIHAHAHTHTQAPPHACTCTHTHTPRQTHGFTYRLVHTQAHTDQGTLHVSTHTDPLTYTHTHTHTCSHIGSHMLAHTCSRTALRTGSPPPRGAPPAAHAPASPTAPSGSSGLSPVPLLREIL